MKNRRVSSDEETHRSGQKQSYAAENGSETVAHYPKAAVPRRLVHRLKPVPLGLLAGEALEVGHLAFHFLAGLNLLRRNEFMIGTVSEVIESSAFFESLAQDGVQIGLHVL